MNKHLSSIKKTAVLVAVGWLAVPAFAGLGGFVDAQVGGGQNANAADTNLNSQIADAAVYLTKELGRGKMMIDIPFSYRADNVTQTANAGFVSAFRSFNTKAQAYINWSYDFGLSWTLGRFDSPFLNEANDTVGLGPYTSQGAIFGALPRMHNGLMLTYGRGPVTVMGIASRPSGMVATATGAAAANARPNDERLEWGVLGKYTHDMGYLGAGLYLQKPGTSATAETHSIVEVMAGTKMSDWTIDAQALFTKVATAGADSGFAIGGTINYNWDKMWAFGIRPNYLSKVGTNDSTTNLSSTWHTANGNNSTFELTVGPQATMSDDLRIRADYKWTSTKPNAGDASQTSSAYTLSAVYKF
jgi:hypothetical protein